MNTIRVSLFCTALLIHGVAIFINAALLTAASIAASILAVLL